MQVIRRESMLTAADVTMLLLLIWVVVMLGLAVTKGCV